MTADAELFENAPADLAWALDRIAQLEAQRAELLDPAYHCADEYAIDGLAWRIRAGEFGPLPEQAQHDKELYAKWEAQWYAARAVWEATPEGRAELARAELWNSIRAF